ncbi:MAG: hypothetical protein J5I98_17340 [Phaeodactylibacter sp.]|nr:hypothetical protein [Phaeodactylibacter sp.]
MFIAFYGKHEFVASNAKEFSDAPELSAHTFFPGQDEPNPAGASTTIRYSIPGADFGDCLGLLFNHIGHIAFSQ